jgi:hypothetical protein
MRPARRGRTSAASRTSRDGFVDVVIRWMTSITRSRGSSMSICHAVLARPWRIVVATKFELHCNT